jgi:hypothetical protein
MKESKPPALALWMMNAMGADPAVIGDLVETHATGRTAGWFWRQAIAASAPSPLNALRWAGAIPVAFYLGGFLESQSYRLGWTLLDPRGHAFLGWRWYLPSDVGVFLSSASLVLLGTLIVPTRKRLVANCLLGIVCAMWGLVALIGLVRPFVALGQPFHWSMFATVVSGLLGGFVAYAIVHNRFDSHGETA